MHLKTTPARLMATFMVGALPLAVAGGQTLAQDIQEQPNQGLLESDAGLLWLKHNRSIALHGLRTAQNYREIDTSGQTTDGTFNSERGHWQGTGLQARWQGQLGPAPLWLQATATEATGQTHYNGYLQSGDTFTPYQAKTGNRWQSQTLRIGVPWSAATIPAIQLIPYLQWGRQHWQRNLVQYSESYRSNYTGLGLLAQWVPAPRWAVEVGVARWAQSQVRVEVPQLNFASSQPGSNPTEYAFGASWQPLANLPAWSLQAQVTHIRWSNGSSPVVSGLQAPPSTTQQTHMLIGLAWNY